MRRSTTVAERAYTHGTSSEIFKAKRLLENLLKDRDPSVRLEVINTLFEMDRDDNVAAVRLVQELSSLSDTTPEQLSEEKRLEIHNTIISILRKIGQAAVPALVESLKNPRLEVRRDVSLLLGEAKSIPQSRVHNLIEALDDSDEAVRINVARAIERCGINAKEAAPELVKLLQASDDNARLIAARALFAIDVDLVQVGPIFNTTLTDDMVQRTTRSQLETIASGVITVLDDELASLSYATHRKPSTGTNGRPTTNKDIPAFPWPPPRYAESYVLPRNSLANDADTLGQAFERLKQALGRNGYDLGLFSVPGGIAIATKVERIYDDGNSYAPPDRWTKGKVAPGSVREFFSSLFMEKPGQFRMFVFVITPQNSVSGGVDELPETSASALSRSGAGVLPRDMEDTPFKGLNCHVIIYRFQKRVGQTATIEHEDPIGLGPEIHLRRSGLLGQLGL